MRGDLVHTSPSRNARFRATSSVVAIPLNGTLLVCPRKYLALLTTRRSGLIVNLSYFQNVIEEAPAAKVTDEYGRYLRQRVGGWMRERQISAADRQLTRTASRIGRFVTAGA